MRGWLFYEGGKGGHVGGWVVLFKVGGCRVSPRFHLFVFDVNQGNRNAGWSCHWNCKYFFGGVVVGSSNAENWVTIKGRNSLYLILLKPKFCLKRSIRVYIETAYTFGVGGVPVEEKWRYLQKRNFV